MRPHQDRLLHRGPPRPRPVAGGVSRLFTMHASHAPDRSHFNDWIQGAFGCAVATSAAEKEFCPWIFQASRPRSPSASRPWTIQNRPTATRRTAITLRMPTRRPRRRRYRPARAFASINWRKAPDARYASRNLEIVAGVFRLRADARPRNDRTHQPSSSL